MIDWLYNLFHRQPTSIEAQMRQIAELQTKLVDLKYKEIQMSADLDSAVTALEAQVAASTSAENSALVLINGIAAQVQELATELAAEGVDTSRLTALTASLKSSADVLAAAVVANTPAAPAQ